MINSDIVKDTAYCNRAFARFHPGREQRGGLEGSFKDELRHDKRKRQFNEDWGRE
jgi:hypothetical protein